MNANGGRSFGAGRGTFPEFLRLLDASESLNQSYEALRSSLRLLNGARPLKTLLFTSAQPEEGKTTVAVGLALAMARAGKRVLIVDADLRRPKVHRLLGLQNTTGLGDIIAADLCDADAVQAVEIPAISGRQPRTLSVVTGGHAVANAFDALQSPALEEVIRHVASAYDAVLIDSPPVLSVSDPLLLAPLVDGVVFVVNTGAVTEADARRAKERIDQVGGHIVGVVMNRFDEQLHGPSFHPYHGYYAAKSQD
jgi:capsular exopolysaccharide synthesis family protein